VLLAGLFAFGSTMSHAACTDPSYAKLKPPKYPQASLASKSEGRVLVQVTVGVDGVPGNVTVYTSSGNPELDQAARGAVAEWRFNPGSCDGKAVIGQAIVPVDFNLSEETAGAGTIVVPSDMSAADATVVAYEGRELTTDTMHLSAASAAELLKQLGQEDGRFRSRVYQINPTTTLSFYFRPEERAEFEVLQSTAQGWNAVDGAAGTSIIRTRFISAGRMTRELYSQLCDGDAEWCRSHLADYVARMRTDPPPIPPPAPRPAAQSDHGSR
jgi:TonB family protein